MRNPHGQFYSIPAHLNNCGTQLISLSRDNLLSLMGLCWSNFSAKDFVCRGWDSVETRGWIFSLGTFAVLEIFSLGTFAVLKIFSLGTFAVWRCPAGPSRGGMPGSAMPCYAIMPPLSRMSWMMMTMKNIIIIAKISHLIILDICHGRHGYTRVNLFWPV